MWDNQPAASTDVDFTPDGLNRYASVDSTAFTYDANSNLTSDGVTTYTYNTRNQLSVVQGSGTTTLQYDPLGRLYQIYDFSSGTIERLLYDGNDLIAEYNSAGAMLDRYVHGVSGGDDPSIAYPGSNADHTAAEYLYADRLGSIVASFNRSGGLETINAYDEFGMPGSAGGAQNSGRFRYTGQIFIPEIGLYHYKARAYSPGLGRFMQTDPIGYGDGLNMYGYVGNDPVNGRDFFGLKEDSEIVVRADRQQAFRALQRALRSPSSGFLGVGGSGGGSFAGLNGGAGCVGECDADVEATDDRITVTGRRPSNRRGGGFLGVALGGPQNGESIEEAIIDELKELCAEFVKAGGDPAEAISARGRRAINAALRFGAGGGSGYLLERGGRALGFEIGRQTTSRVVSTLQSSARGARLGRGAGVAGAALGAIGGAVFSPELSKFQDELAKAICGIE